MYSPPLNVGSLTTSHKKKGYISIYQITKEKTREDLLQQQVGVGRDYSRESGVDGSVLHMA